MTFIRRSLESVFEVALHDLSLYLYHFTVCCLGTTSHGILRFKRISRTPTRQCSRHGVQSEGVCLYN